MAKLIVEFNQRRAEVPLGGRLSIGSQPGNRIVLRAAGVLPQHAAIEAEGEEYVLHDFSRGEATRLNGRPAPPRQFLNDGDLIAIGGARFTFRVAAVEGPSPAKPASRPVTPGREAGQTVAFDCRCGARLKAPERLGGREANCRRCGQRVTIPYLAAVVEAPAVADEPAEAVEEICSICQTPLMADDDAVACDACGLPYHRECWMENLGCAAYGCANVGALKAGPDIRLDGDADSWGVPVPLPADAPVAPPDEAFPWEYALLGASALAALLGLFSCGLPPLLVGLAGVVGMVRTLQSGGQPRWIVLALAWGLSALALLAGFGVSLYLFG